MTRRKTGSTWVIIRGISLPLIAAGLLLFYDNLGKTPLVDELFTLQLSRWILNGISTITALVPFSIAELLAVLLAAGVAISLFNLLAALIRGKERIRALFRITNLVSVLIIGFLLFWGFNYRQMGLEQATGLAPLQIPVQELETMAKDLVGQAKTERSDAGFDDLTAFELRGDLHDAATTAYERLARDYPGFGEPIGRAKPLLSSRAFSYMGISGIFAPYTAEANYNNDQQDLLKASSVLHELAHLKGVAREEEANFTAYLASRYATDPAFRYSGTMLALINAGNRLAKVDMAAFNRINAMYSEGMRLDLREHNQYWKQFEGEVREKAETVNDQYLKSNGQAAGVESYEDMVSYLYAFKKQTGSVNLK